MRVGLRVCEWSKICLFSGRWQVEITLVFHIVHPVGLVSVPPSLYLLWCFLSILMLSPIF